MFIRAAKKSVSAAASRDNAIRSFVSASERRSGRFSFSAANSVGKTSHIVRMTSSTLNGFADCGDSSLLLIGRPPVGNPSTMAFLGIRAKSSGAAFRHQVEGGDDEDILYSTGGGGISGKSSRTHHEAWMVNLGRGDEEWLTGPRGEEWYTGLKPSLCPGE